MPRIRLVTRLANVMYNTPLGIRVLQGAERRLFVESLAMIVDNLSVVDGPFEVAIFDRLQRNQKIAILHTMARALLCGQEPVPRLTAPIEAAVATVYRHMRTMISLELEGEIDELEDVSTPKPPSWRKRVLAAGREAEIDDLPSITEDDPEEWDLLLECLEDCVLWDNDWEMEEQLDMDPDVSQRVKREMGIADDYFIAVPPDPTDDEAGQLLSELFELTADAR